jgi:hypothetical protein
VTRKAIAEKDMAELSDLELAELRKKAHAYDSEQGRLQKTQAELEAERAQRAELEKRLAAANQATPTALDPKALEIFGQDGVEHLNNMLSPVLSKLDMIGKKFEERDTVEAQARAAKTYQEALDAKLSGNNLPGFVYRLYSGDLSSVWSKFAEEHPAVRRAQSEGDVETISDMVNIFILQNKELVAGGGYSPQSVPGFSSPVKCDYTDADYVRDKKILQRQLDDTAITEKEFNEKADALYGRWVAAQEKAEQTATAYGLV